MATVPDVHASLHGGDADGADIVAEAWQSRVAGQAAGNTERLDAETNLAVSLLHQEKDTEAEPMLRRLHEVRMRVHAAEHPDTLTNAANLASSLPDQCKHADAERIRPEVHEVQKRVLGAEHADTLRVRAIWLRTSHA